MNKKSKYGSKMKGGRTVKNTKYSSKMSKGMTVPNFQDTVIEKMFSGGTLKSRGSSNIKLPTGMQPVKRSTPSNKMVGQPKTVGKNKPNIQTPPKIRGGIRSALASGLSGKRGATKSSSAPRSIPKKPKKKTGRGDI